MSMLALRRTVFHDGERRADDYEVRYDGRTVGRILRLRSTGRELWQQIGRLPPFSTPSAGSTVVAAVIGWDLPGAQTRETALINRILPGEKFLDCEHITAAGFFKR